MGDADAALTAKFGTLEPDVRTELQSMMRLHDLSAEEVFWKWEEWSIKMEIDAGEVTLGSVRSLKERLQEELERKASRGREIKADRKVVGTPRGGGGVGAGGDVYSVLDGLVPRTPSTGVKRDGKKTPGSKLRESVMNSSPAEGKIPGAGEEHVK
jgi:DNA polymerase alpha subunit B